MSASYAAHQARQVKNESSLEAKIDKLADAIDHLARAIDDIERKIKQLR